MSMKIKVHVLSKWNICEFGLPMVFSNYDSAYKEMEKQYEQAFGTYSYYSKDETDIYDDSAKITSDDGVEEWQIVECEMEINNLYDFASSFETLLGQYSADFEKFVNSLPHTMTMATELSNTLGKLQKLLNAAMPVYDRTNKGGVV